MRPIRLTAAAAMMLLSAGAVIQASAADTGGPTTVTFTTPASSGQTISSGPVVLSGVVNRPSGFVDSVQVLVRWTDTVPGRPKIAHPDQTTVATPQGQVSSYTWTFPLAPSANGQYEAVVTATTDDGGNPKQTQQTIVASSFSLDVAPVTPTGVVSTVNKDRSVGLKWTANPEPDLIGYDVFRAGPTAADGFKFLNGVYAPTTSLTDTTVQDKPAGTYRYILVAVRPGAQGGIDHLRYSDRSAESDAAVTTPPVTPTTTVPAGANGAPGATGGSGGGNVPGIQRTAVPLVPQGDPLSSYQSLVNEANATTATTEPPDTGYNNQLPYQSRTSSQAIQVPGSGSLGAPDSSSSNGASSHQSVEFIAGALLLAVIAGFALLIKRAADQPVLEAAPVEKADDPRAAVDALAALFTPVGLDAPARPLRSHFRH